MVERRHVGEADFSPIKIKLLSNQPIYFLPIYLLAISLLLISHFPSFYSHSPVNYQINDLLLPYFYL
jgi:hypothetical protein